MTRVSVYGTVIGNFIGMSWSDAAENDFMKNRGKWKLSRFYVMLFSNLVPSIFGMLFYPNKRCRAFLYTYLTAIIFDHVYLFKEDTINEKDYGYRGFAYWLSRKFDTLPKKDKLDGLIGKSLLNNLVYQSSTLIRWYGIPFVLTRLF